MFTTLFLALVGQTCNIRGTYQQQAVSRSYTATLYQQPTYAATYNAQVYTQYVPVVYADYNAIVGDQQRTYDRRTEALKAQADLALRLDRINETLQKIGTPVEAPPQQLQRAPDAPGKPLPPVRANPSPQRGGEGPPIQPPVPKTNPDDGSVPPPPAPGPVPGAASFSAE